MKRLLAPRLKQAPPGGACWLGLLGRQPGFARLLSAQALTYLNVEIWYVAMPFALLQMTQSPFWMGVTAAAGYLPNLLASAAAGWWVDRSSARRVLIASAWGRAGACLGLAALGWSGQLSLPVLAFGCFALGAFGVAHATAKRAWIPSLVPGRAVGAANCLDEGAFGLAEVIGTLGGGLVVSTLGPWAALLAQAALLAGGGALALRIPEPAAASASRGGGFGEGFAYLLAPRRASRILLSSLAIASVLHACCMAYFSMQVFYYGSGLHLGSATVGWMIAAVSAAGAAGSFLTERVVARLRLGNAILFFALCVASGLLLAAVAPSAWTAAAAAGLILAGGKALRVVRVTLCQGLTPKPLLGRVNGVYHMLVEGGTPAVAMASGAMARSLGFPVTFALAGLAGLGACLFFFSTPLKGLAEARQDVPDAPALLPADA